MLATHHLTDYSVQAIDLLPRLRRVYAPEPKDIYPETFILGRFAARSNTVVTIKPVHYEARLATVRVLDIRRVEAVGCIRYAAVCYIRETGTTKLLPMTSYTRLQVQ